MGHKITFYHLGNADTSLIELENGKKILLDYANVRSVDDKDDKRADLPTELNKVVKEDGFSAVGFTHADEDHVKGFSEYFYLEHDVKYQTKNRKKILDLWVPAAVLLQSDADIKHDDGKILKKEARYRLKNKKGIKVFSKPDKLKKWLENEGIKFEDVQHLIVDAGKTIPGWTLENEGIEFFVHSPFAAHADDKDIERNEACLILQVTFNNKVKSKAIFGADADSDLWDDIVDITKHFKNEIRLQWDIFHISHHCSYKSLNVSECGDNITCPTDQVKWLFETQGNKKSIIISPSKVIPDNFDEIQPPHKQGANYYENVADLKDGEFKVTMEYPSKESPSPLIVKIDDSGVTIDKSFSNTGFITNKPAPRAG